jgi:hypothetical protein
MECFAHIDFGYTFGVFDDFCRDAFEGERGAELLQYKEKRDTDTAL